MGSIVAVVYPSVLVLPPQLPADAARAAAGTPGGAVAAAEQLPVEIREGLLGSTAEAFMAGMNAAAVVAAVLVAGLAVLALTAFRTLPSHASPAPDPDPSDPAERA